jgi:hypothetical protein
MHNGFPVAYDIQDKLIVAANKLSLLEIKTYLSEMIKAERKPRMIPDEVKKIIGL